jgi:hypothetical protein
MHPTILATFSMRNAAQLLDILLAARDVLEFADWRLTQRLVTRGKSLSAPFAVISEWLVDPP